MYHSQFLRDVLLAMLLLVRSKVGRATLLPRLSWDPCTSQDSALWFLEWKLYLQREPALVRVKAKQGLLWRLREPHFSFRNVV